MVGLNLRYNESPDWGQDMLRRFGVEVGVPDCVDAKGKQNAPDDYCDLDDAVLPSTSVDEGPPVAA